MNLNERIVKARMALVLHQPFFGSLALRLKPVCVPEIETAGTDGKILAYAPDFINGLTDAQLRFLIAHEVMHCSNGHIWRRGHRDPERWNIACDYAIDPVLDRASTNARGTRVMELPPGAHIRPEFIGMSAEDIYEQLTQEARQEQQQRQQQGQGQGQGEGQDQGQSQGDGEGEGQGKRPRKTYGQVLDAAPSEASESEQEWKQATIQAARIAKAQGHLPRGLERLVESLHQPAVNWRAVLRRFVQQLARLDYAWARPNSRYTAMGLYLPTIQSEQMPPIVVVFDTSGSIGGDELSAFDAELRSIVDECRPEATHLVFCDAAVDERSCVELLPDDPIAYTPTGGGGTSFIPAFEWVQRQGIEPACLIYLTDCYGTFPAQAPDYPVLWASTTKEPGRYQPPFGEFVYIGGAQ